ncbi:uncharacterized protein LOC113049076 [Carassius auratus]|uniref:Uncharacterized protein LOC113049076 n=1 Tax=Carassius auratus TaxID=7957 RepID=A0A6P6K4A4_CARAU|nr:uncharacterized protein LOC113049076 [Carassius auratus]
MFRWCPSPLCTLIFILICMVSTNSSSPIGHRKSLSFSNSLRLTRTVRARVQQLLSRYKQQLFGDELFEYRDMKLSSLPAVTVSYQTWLNMQDTERLRLASNNLQSFWTHLEIQRQQLERERDAMKERRGKRGKPQSSLRQKFVSLQIDLRDLMKQVSSQLNSLSTTESTKTPLLHPLHATSSSGPLPSMHHSTERPTVLQTPTGTDNHRSSAHSSTQSTTVMERTSLSLPQPTLASEGFIFTGRSVDTQQTTTAETSRWIQHLKGYVILRDLERYLRRLARDYAVLQAKY